MTTRPYDRPREQCTRLPVTLGAAALIFTMAGEGAAETPEQRRTDLLRGAAAALRAGRPSDAIAKWRAAWDIRPAPEIACDIGTGEFLYGSPRAAAEFLSICEREYPASPRDKDRMAEYKKNLAKAREQIGALDIRVEEASAAVLIDGRNVGRTPLNEIFVDPGAHRIEVALDGYMRHEMVVTVNKGEQRTISIKLAKLKPTDRGAPLHPKPAPTPATKSNAPKVSIAIAGGATAIIGAGIGIGFAVASNNAADDRHSNRSEMKWGFGADCNEGATQPPCAGYVNAEQARRHDAAVATGAFISAGIIAAATIAYVVFPRTLAKPTARTTGATFTVYQWQ